MSAPNRRQLNIALAIGGVVFACVSLAHVPGLTLGLGYLAPAVFVFVLLWLGHYPGERLLVALSRRSERRRGTPILHGAPPRPGAHASWRALAVLRTRGARAPPLSLG